MDSGDETSDTPSAFVQEAACAERVIVLKVRAPGQTSFILIASSPADQLMGIGLLSAERRRELWGGRLPSGATRQRLREDSLSSARVLSMGDREVFIDQHGDLRVIRAEQSRVVITDTTPTSWSRALPFVTLGEAERAALEAKGLELAQAIARDAVLTYRAEVEKILERAAQKIDRRVVAIQGDIDKIAQADRIASQAQWLVAEAAKAPRGATKLVVTDWSSGEPIPMVVPLDPSRSAKDQVVSMFKRAKRLRLGVAIASERLARAEEQRAAVQSSRDLAMAATTLAELHDVLSEAKRAAPRDVSLPSALGASTSKKAKAPRLPYRTFLARSGRKILVGKGAADNDTLSLRVGRPHDLWLHAKDRTGAHVILVIPKGQSMTAEELIDAAHLAAHFSEAREERIVDVQYTERRYIRKPKGSPPGAVMVDREKVLVLRIEPELLRSLLEREE